jgi:hypothetical protein
MKIGDEETDALFERAIAPAVRAVGVKPIRIDKLEHNDDIDDAILREISRADVVIADLTFARPSVYFEGGYAAASGTPVIYTARRDHFRARDDDPFGNLRVHFDLQMKNIIDWSTPDSPRFRKRLEGRLRHVLAPTLRRKADEAAVLEERATFRRLPVNRQLDAVTQRLKVFGEALNYELVRLDSREETFHLATFAEQLAWTEGVRIPTGTLRRGMIGTRRTPQLIDAAWIRVEDAFTQSRLAPIRDLLEYAPPHDMNPPRGVRPRRVVEHVVLCSLKTVPTSRIRSVFSTYQIVGDRHFVSSMPHFVPSQRLDDAVVLTGRHRYLAAAVPTGYWQALVFAGRDARGGAEHRILNGAIETDPSREGRVIAFPFTKKNPPPKAKKIGKAVEVGRDVHLHVVENVQSLHDLDAQLERLTESIRDATRATKVKTRPDERADA